MANLNLSEFGEKLFVTDADHTFIWDTENSISKRVSRNSWLNSGTLTSDAPVTISQTWNNAAVAFTGLKVNAAGTSGTNSASGSLLLDLQVGGVSKFYVNKAGDINTVTGVNCVSVSGTTGFFGGSVRLNNNAAFLAFGSPSSVVLQRDDADNTLALRNGANAQTFNVYGTSSSSNTVYERMFMRYNGGAPLAFQIGTETAGATARPLEFLTAGVKRLSLAASGSNTASLFALSNTLSNILVIRNLSEAAKFQFYLNGSGNSELYIGASNVLISETGSSYFNGGNVGIGTTAPGAKLDILTSTAFDGIKVTNSHTSSAAFLSLINNTGNDANFGCYSSGTGDGFANNAGFGAKNSVIINADGGVVSGGSNSIQFRAGGYAANQERMRITSAGNVGIGTTSPSSKLQVSAGDVEVDTIAKGVILKSPDGTRYRVTVANGGTLSVAAV